MSAFANALGGMIGMGYGQTPQENAPSGISPYAIGPSQPATSPTSVSTNLSPTQVQQQPNPLGSPNVNPVLRGSPPFLPPTNGGLSPNDQTLGNRMSGGMGVSGT